MKIMVSYSPLMIILHLNRNCVNFLHQSKVCQTGLIVTEHPFNFCKLILVPGEITYGKHVINSTAATVRWNAPKLSSKCVQTYDVLVVGPIQRDPVLQQTYNVTTKETSIEFVGLDPCGEYNITVQAISLNGTGGVEISTSFSTDEDSKL